MRHIHTSIVSIHLATRGITKYCAHLHHTLSALKRYYPASLVARLPNSEQTNHLFSNHVTVDLRTDPAGEMTLLASWTEKLAGGPQSERSDSLLLARVKGVGRQEHEDICWFWYKIKSKMVPVYKGKVIHRCPVQSYYFTGAADESA